MRQSGRWVWMAAVVAWHGRMRDRDGAPGRAAMTNSYVLTFKDNKIEPAELQVPAGVEFKLRGQERRPVAGGI